jgi:serine/threonine protein kinase
MVRKFSEYSENGGGLQHPNVIRMFGLYADNEGNIYMVMEMVVKGNLKGLLPKLRNKITFQEKLDM